MKSVISNIKVIIFSLFFSFMHTTTEDIVTGTSNFLEVAKSKAYVDKTLLLKHIFDYEFMLITAPRRFLKSTNLDTVKTFLEIPVNKTTGQLIRRKESTDNYNTFKQLRIYEKHRRYFDANFGTYPVLYLDLKPRRPVTNYRDSFTVLKESIRRCFVKNSYMCNNDKLTKNSTALCRKWCGADYLDLSDKYVLNGLRNLTYFLYTYYNSKLYVLIDAYDSVITELMFGAVDYELEKSVKLIISQISRLLKGNKYVARGIITGTTHIVATRLSQLKNLKVLKFLHRHKFVEFYGFSEAEVKGLLKNPVFKLNKNEMNELRQWYSGYTCLAGKQIYNPFSLIIFLKFGIIGSYWEEPGYVNNLLLLFKYPSMKEKIENLLNHKNVTIRSYEQLKINDTISLKNTFSGIETNEEPNHHLVCSYLLDSGYLSYLYNPEHSNRTLVRIPNKEIWQYFFNAFKEYYICVEKVKETIFDTINYDNITVCLDRLHGTAKTRSKITKSIYNLGKPFIQCTKYLYRLFRKSKITKE